MSQMQTMTQEQLALDEQRRLFDLAQQEAFEPEDDLSHSGETLTREDLGHSLGQQRNFEEKEVEDAAEISHGDSPAAPTSAISHGDSATPLAAISHGDSQLPHVPLSGPPLVPSAIANPLPGQPIPLPSASDPLLNGQPPPPSLPPEPATDPSPRQAFLDSAASALQAGFEHNPWSSPHTTTRSTDVDDALRQ